MPVAGSLISLGSKKWPFTIGEGAGVNSAGRNGLTTGAHGGAAKTTWSPAANLTEQFRKNESIRFNRAFYTNDRTIE